MHSYIEVPGFGAKWSILKKYHPKIKGYRELGAALGYSYQSPNPVRLWVIEDKIPEAIIAANAVQLNFSKLNALHYPTRNL